MFSLKVVNILCFGSNTELAFEGLISGIFQFKVPVALWEVSQCSLYQYMILYDEVRHLLVWSDINALRQQGLTIQFCTFQSSLSYIIWLHFRILTVFFTDFPGVGRGGWQVFDRIFPHFLLSISAKSCVMDLPFFFFQLIFGTSSLEGGRGCPWGVHPWNSGDASSIKHWDISRWRKAFSSVLLSDVGCYWRGNESRYHQTNP